MKHLCVGIAFLFTLQLNAQWDTLSTGTKAHLKGISFLNDNVGLTCGYDTTNNQGRIYITSDAGLNWAAAAVTDAVYPRLHSITYVNNYVAVAVGDSGVILRSLDSGLNWDTLHRFSSQQLNRVHFVNDTLGFCAGNNGALYKTTDSGASWDTLNCGSVLDIYDIDFISTTTGLLTGSGGFIAKTTDGGFSWTMSLNPFFGFFEGRSVDFRDAGNAVCVGLYGFCLRSFDGGNSWTSFSTGMSNDFYSIRFVTALGGVMAGSNGVILRTGDGGLSWNTESTSSQTRTYYDIAFSNDTTGYICAMAGKVVKNRFDISGLPAVAAAPVELLAYPNPFGDRITLNYTLSESAATQLELLDLTGRSLFMLNEGELAAGMHTRSLELAQLPAGLYLLRISAGTSSGMLRIVKQ